MGYQALELEKVLSIDRIYSVHYFEYGPDYAFTGESHDFWEFVYADKGEVYVTAGEEEKLLINATALSLTEAPALSQMVFPT